MNANMKTAPPPRRGSRAEGASEERTALDSTAVDLEDRYRLACPPGVPLDLWLAYGDRYPGSPRRTRENREEVERYLAQRRRDTARAEGGGPR